MALVCSDPNGRKRIAFKGLDGKRRSIHLGKSSERTANEVRRHVEAMLSDGAADSPLDPRTADWLSIIRDELHAKLQAAELVKPRVMITSITLAQFLDEYAARRTSKSRLVCSTGGSWQT